MANDVTSDQGSTQAPAFRDLTLVRSGEVVGAPARAVFGQVMGLVAATVGFMALGAYIGRNLSGGAGILFFIAGFACIFGLQFATARGREQLAIGLLVALGLALGLGGAPVIGDY